MSLIERAVAEVSEARVASKARSKGQGRKPRSGLSADTDISTSRSFRLDMAHLAEQGFFTPSEKPQRLALEMRVIKRRLLRRMNFYRKSRDDTGERNNRSLPSNTVLMTSTRPAEGKTFTAINLALSLAIEDNINVMLIDSDVPRPKVFTHLGLEAGPGLTDCIADPALPIASTLLREENYPLTVMSQGTRKEAPTEIFSRPEMEAFVGDVARRYPDRIIIFDAPPVLATPEATVLAKYVSEVLFVVEANGTPEPAVAAALDELLDSSDRISLVLNRCLVSSEASQYGSYEEYYYKSDQSRRGKGVKGK